MSLRCRRAFSLVEIAIVLIIIGLLVGGILSGRALMQGQRMRAVLADAKSYAFARQTFLDKYGALPGDMPDATRIWGRADGGADLSANCASPATNASSGVPTCNGDGNGIVSPSEGFWAWQQLRVAEMIVGDYNGIAGAGGADNARPGVNTPVGKLTGSTYAWMSWGDMPGGDASFFPGNYDNVLVFGAFDSVSWPNKPALTPSEAYEIDKKIDDGRPGVGVVRTRAKTWMDASTGTCVTDDTETAAQYSVSSAKAGCFLYFMRDFGGTKQQ